MVDPIAEGYNLRQADWSDAIQIQKLLNSHVLTHRYLDWRDPIQWLGMKPFLLLEKHEKLQAIMACPPDPPGIAWVRLFSCSWETPLDLAWNVLCSEAIRLLTIDTPTTRCYILPLEKWFDTLLQRKLYKKYQEIVILQRELDSLSSSKMPPEMGIRQMREDDLQTVTNIDSSSFEAIWIYSAHTIELAFQQSGVALIAEIQGKPVGYLLCTLSGSAGHLARIAILPEHTRRHIATHLIEKLLMDLKLHGFTQITLNTQSNNQASLALYDKMGFRRTGETFGVYQIL